MQTPDTSNIDIDEVMELCENDNNEGMCCACGDIAYGVEPDARGYACESCDEPAVFGAMELLMRHPYGVVSGIP